MPPDVGRRLARAHGKAHKFREQVDKTRQGTDGTGSASLTTGKRSTSRSAILREWVLLHGFTKRTTQTSERDIRIAEARMTEYLERQKRVGP